MPQRDGAPTEQEIAAQRAGKGPPPHRGGSLPPHAAAVAALRATAAAARVAATAPPVIAPVLTVAAINAAAAGILGAFDRFLDTRRQDQEQYVMGLLATEVPDLPEDQRLGVLGAEMDAEKQFSVKARDRLDRDLPKALSIADPGVREAQVQKILDRERRYAEMREQAMATRTLGTAEQQRVEALSPEGGFWRLSPHVREHTLDCLAMGNKVWPHSVLRTYHPPLHGGCPCEIWTIQEAQNAGLITSPTQYATPDQSLYAMQVVEAEFDREEFEDELAVLEAVQERWWKGTAGPGQFRARKGDLARGLRRPRDPGFAPVPTVEPIRDLNDQELKLREMETEHLTRGARVMIEGELQKIRTVLAPGVFELEDGSAVRTHGGTAFGIPADDEPEQPVEEAVEEPVVESPEPGRLFYADVEALVGMGRPEESSEIAPGFYFDAVTPPARTQTDSSGMVRVSEAFFRQPRRSREGIVLRQLGYRLARFLGEEGIEALSLFDQSLGAAKGIAEAYVLLNRPGDGWDVGEPSHVMRLIAEAAAEAEVPLHPVAEPLADGPSVSIKEGSHVDG